MFNIIKNDYKKFTIELLYFILVSLIFTSIDLNNYSGKCIYDLKQPTKTKALFIIMGHHLLATISNFGWLATSKIFLSLFITLNIIIIIHWFTNQNKCTATEHLNKICGFPEDHLFPDFFFIIGLKKYNFWNKWASYVYYICAVIYSFYKLTL